MGVERICDKISPTRYNERGECKQNEGFPFPIGHDSKGVVKQRADILPTPAAGRKGWREWEGNIMERDSSMISIGPVVTPGRVSHRGNVTPASPGRVDGPAACGARRGPDGVRGVVDFCEPAKIHDIPGIPTGDIPSRMQPDGRET